jgi:competence protein ComGC
MKNNLLLTVFTIISIVFMINLNSVNTQSTQILPSNGTTNLVNSNETRVIVNDLDLNLTNLTLTTTTTITMTTTTRTISQDRTNAERLTTSTGETSRMRSNGGVANLKMTLNHLLSLTFFSFIINLCCF